MNSFINIRKTLSFHLIFASLENNIESLTNLQKNIKTKPLLFVSKNTEFLKNIK